MRGREPGGRAAVVPLLLAAAACANELPPPGAAPDARPPRVAAFDPPAEAVVPELGGSARISFDEPVRLSTDPGRSVEASPAFRYRYETGFSELRIRPEGGWREGVVYCFEIAEGIADLLGNRTREPIRYCFSTGPPVLSTRVKGRVEDRLTGAAVAGARVLFLGPAGEEIPYTAVADREGAFERRALPPGGYWAYGFRDGNRNLRLDRQLEAHDSLRFVVEEAADPEPLRLALVEPDSTPPRLLEARAADSLTLRLEFDDPLAPEQPVARVAVTDSLGAERAARRLHVGEPSTLEREKREAPEPPETPGAAGPGGAEGDGRSPTPSRTLTLVLEEPLAPGRYVVRADGFVNLRGLVGGGEAGFAYPPEGPSR